MKLLLLGGISIGAGFLLFDGSLRNEVGIALIALGMILWGWVDK